MSFESTSLLPCANIVLRFRFYSFRHCLVVVRLFCFGVYLLKDFHLTHACLVKMLVIRNDSLFAKSSNGTHDCTCVRRIKYVEELLCTLYNVHSSTALFRSMYYKIVVAMFYAACGLHVWRTTMSTSSPSPFMSLKLMMICALLCISYKQHSPVYSWILTRLIHSLLFVCSHALFLPLNVLVNSKDKKNLKQRNWYAACTQTHPCQPAHAHTLGKKLLAENIIIYFSIYTVFVLQRNIMCGRICYISILNSSHPEEKLHGFISKRSSSSSILLRYVGGERLNA